MTNKKKLIHYARFALRLTWVIPTLILMGISFFTGWLLWLLIRPLAALARLMMLRPWTAWEELTDVEPSHDLRDLRL